MATEYMPIRFTGDNRDAVTAAQQLRSALRAVAEEGDDAGDALVHAARRTVAENAKQVQGQRKLVDAYQATARAARQGSAEQVAAERLAERAARQLGDSYERVGREARQAGRSFDRSNASLGRFVRGGIAGTGVLQGLRGQIAFASSAFLGGAGLIGAITGTIKVAADFEQQMNVLGGVTRASGREMQAAGRLARQLGRDTQLPATSAKDASMAMTELSKAGLSLRESMNAARGTLQLAAAAGTDAATAARISANALNAFNLEGDRAGHVADVLAGAANASSGEITDMAYSLSQAASSAHASGLSVGDTATAIALLAKNGILGSDAGTSLRVMLQRLIPSTDKAKDAVKELGINIFDAHGRMLPFRDVIGQYEQALDRLTPKQRAQALQIIFGTDAQRAANIIFGAGQKQFDNLGAAVTRQGNAADVSAAKMKGFRGALDAFRSAVETLAIQLGSALLPKLTPLIRRFAEWTGQQEASGNLQRRLNGYIETASNLIGDLVSVYRSLRGPVRAVVDLLGGFRQTLWLIIGLGIVSKVQRWAGAFAMLGGPEGIGKADAAAGRLQTKLRWLSRLKTIGITIALTYAITNKDQIDKWGDWLDERLGIKGVFGSDLGDPNAGLRKDETFGGDIPGLTGDRLKIARQIQRLRRQGLTDAQIKKRLMRGHEGDSGYDLIIAQGLEDADRLEKADRNRSRGGRGGAGAATGSVTVAPGANRAGVPIQPHVIAFVRDLADYMGAALTIGTGTNHNKYVSGTNRESDHWTGNAADIPASGRFLTRLGQGALIVAGASPGWAREQGGGAYNVGGVNILFNTTIGGNHFNHLHVGLKSWSPRRDKGKSGRVEPRKTRGDDTPKGDASDFDPGGDKAGRSNLIPRRLRLAYAEAQLTKTTRDDLRVLRQIEDYLEQRIRREKNVEKKIDLLEELRSTRERIASIREGKDADKAKRGISRVIDVREIQAQLPRLGRQLAQLLASGILDRAHYDVLRDALTNLGALVAGALRDGIVTPRERAAVGKAFNSLNTTIRNGIRDMKINAGYLREVRAVIRDALKDGLISDDELGRIDDKVRNLKGTLGKRLQEAVKTITDSREKFDAAWNRLKDVILRAFEERVIGRVRLNIEFAEQQVTRATAVKQRDRAQGQIAAAEAGGLTPVMQTIKERGESLINAWRALNDAARGKDRDEIDRRAAALAEAQNQWDGLAGDWTDAETAYRDAYQRAIDAERDISRAALEDFQKEDEAKQRLALRKVDKDLNKIYADLRAGKITLAQAETAINELLAPFGLSLADLGETLDNAELEDALGELTTAVKELTDALKTLGNAAPPIRPVGGTIGGVKPPTQPDGVDGATVAAYRAAPAAAPTSQVLHVTVPVTLSGGVIGTADEIGEMIAGGVQRAFIREGVRLGGNLLGGLA